MPLKIAAKAPKNSSATPKKTAPVGSGSDSKRHKKAKPVGALDVAGDFRTYIHRVLKKVDPPSAKKKTRMIRSKAMTIINDVCLAILDKACDSIVSLHKMTKLETASFRDSEAVLRLTFTGELGLRAASQAAKHVAIHRALLKAKKEEKK